MAWADHVHLPAGFQPAGRKVRAVCHCGEVTTPRVDHTHALLGLAEDHGWTRPSCVRCGRDRTPPGAAFDQFHQNLTVTTDLPEHPGEVLICRDTAGCDAAVALTIAEQLLRTGSGDPVPATPMDSVRRGHLRIVPNL